MPRPTLPPTPGSSTDIKGREGPQMGFSQISFELPPPAIMSSESRPSSAATHSSSASSYHPASPKTIRAPTARRRSSAANASATMKESSNFSLPPPPTRSRKIIQMKPRESKVQQEGDTKANTEVQSKAAPAAGNSATKKKQPSATSVAGRKIARKTAHSLIERRRRSKMNEEFGVLKDMIPACTGDMHKLAILQASIDYIRYLEDCVGKLKAQTNRSTPTPDSPDYPVPPGRRPSESYEQAIHQDQYEEEGDEDVEMEGSEAASPVYTQAPTAFQQSQGHQPSISPVMLAQDSRYRQNSYSSATTSDTRHYSYSTSATTSPAFGPQAYEYALSATSGSALTSPALLPQSSSDRDLDHEATAALLMLNTDRRGTVSGSSGRGGMSVRDLLSA